MIILTTPKYTSRATFIHFVLKLLNKQGRNINSLTEVGNDKSDTLKYIDLN